MQRNTRCNTRVCQLTPLIGLFGGTQCFGKNSQFSIESINRRNNKRLNQCTNLMHQFIYYLYKHLLQSSTCFEQSCLSSEGEIVLTQHLVSSLWKQECGLK
jgi:hypothetical protein